jgi:hypothetical protein
MHARVRCSDPATNARDSKGARLRIGEGARTDWHRDGCIAIAYIVGNSPNGDMIARTRSNSTTTKTVNKKGGKITTSSTNVVSSDGKTRTLTTTGTNALGQTVNSVAVFDRQ